MVSKAKQTNGFTCEQGDIRIINLKKKYDAVVSLFHVVSYSITNNAVASVFNNAFRHLNKDGLFVFDFWYSPAVYSQKPEIRVKRLSSDDCYITRIAEPILYPNENRVDVNYTIIANDTSNGNYYSFEETHPMRHFSLPELDQVAELAGFERLAAEEWLTAIILQRILGNSYCT